VKAAPFAYLRASSLPDALEKFAASDNPRWLSGGQSLLPALALRLDTPGALIDISRLAELRGIALRSDVLHIGAGTRHAELASDPLVAVHAPLLAQAAPHIAHPAIRTRGTLGGSLALADPAAELPACALALEATIVLRGPAGERRVAAPQFHRGLYETALTPGEVLTALEVPALAHGWRSCLMELCRRSGDYAIVGLAAHARVADGRIAEARLAFFGVGTTPVRAARAEAALPDVTAAQAALEHDLDPPGDLHGPPALRKHLARVLLGRAAAKLLA
jgi:carbon-monoxide dehydrogenase medium subunit